MQLSKKFYNKLLNEHKLKKKYLLNALKAFVFGGIVSLIGQIFIEIYQMFFTNKEAITLMLLSVITIAIILSAFGIYDKLGQIGRCGLVIPITGDAR